MNKKAASSRKKNSASRPKTTVPAKKAAVPAKKQAEVEESYSISQLAEYFNCDRNTLAKKIEEAGIAPVVNRANNKRYRLEDVEPLFEVAEQLDAVKLRKLSAETELKELELSQERGDLLPRKEVEDHVQKLFAALFQRLNVRLPKEIAGQLSKAKNAAEITQILQTSITTIFNELRRDHTKLLGSHPAGDS